MLNDFEYPLMPLGSEWRDVKVLLQPYICKMNKFIITTSGVNNKASTLGNWVARLHKY